MVSQTCSSSLPPGFRFHPTDEELIMYYLRNQATSQPFAVPIIAEVDIYKFDPWQLPEKAEFGENEWYFFSPRERKYPNGMRPNRATLSGYWKATGTDKGIYSGSKYVGVKKSLVFYKGRPPKGIKTDWIMHEYRLSDSRSQAKKQNGSMRLDDWVLCRIYKKKHTAGKVFDQKIDESDSKIEIQGAKDVIDHQEKNKFSRTCSVSHLLDLEFMGPISQLLISSQNTCDSGFGFQTSTIDDAEMNLFTDLAKFQGGILNQQAYMNPMGHQFP
ncbi:hypothetical protein SLE2022_159370 [Rubroshorea leprosula]